MPAASRRRSSDVMDSGSRLDSTAALRVGPFPAGYVCRVRRRVHMNGSMQGPKSRLPLTLLKNLHCHALSNMSRSYTQKELAESLLSVYADIISSGSNPLDGPLPEGIGVAAEVELLRRLATGESLTSAHHFWMYMKTVLDVLCLVKVAGSQSRHVNELPKIEQPKLLGTASVRRALFLERPASAVDDWMLEQRVRAWALSRNLHVGPPPREGKKAEFIVDEERDQEAIECKRRNTPADSDDALLQWIWGKLEQASTQLKCTIGGDSGTKTVVIDVSRAANQEVSIPTPTADRKSVV